MAIDTGVGTADRREIISGGWELGRKKILKRFELDVKKILKIIFSE